MVNCVILGRAEAFASKNRVGRSVLDGLGIGIGFTIALVIVSFFREVLGAGQLFGLDLVKGVKPASVFILAPGAFLVVGLLMGLFQYRKLQKGGA